MTDTKRILGIVGSYRKDGVIDSLVSTILAAAAEKGADVRKMYLSDSDIRFCTNCRECAQLPGKEYVPCVVHDDEMTDIVGQILLSDAIVVGAPVNMGSINALTQRLIERCIGFGYYPWGNQYPVLRDKEKRRDAILVSSSAAPSFMNSRIFGVSAISSLHQLANLVGARVTGTIKVGLVNKEEFALPKSAMLRARRAGHRIAA